MSRKSKSKSKEKRRKEKRARRQAMRAKYEAFRIAGKNTKSKRFAARSKKRKTLKLSTHPLGKCGNSGCQKCFGISFRNFLRDGKPYRMPQKMFLAWKKLRVETKDLPLTDQEE